LTVSYSRETIWDDNGHDGASSCPLPGRTAALLREMAGSHFLPWRKPLSLFSNPYVYKRVL